MVAVAALSGAAAFEEVFDGVVPAPVTVRCREPGSWKFSVTRGARTEPGVGELEIALVSPTSAVPPAFSVSFELPQRDSAYFWRSQVADCGMTPDWYGANRSRLSRDMPLYTYFSESGTNRLTVSTSEVKRDVDFKGGLREEGSVMPVSVDFFVTKEQPIREYRTRVRFDWRDIAYDESVRAAAEWMASAAQLHLADVPEAAFDPVYSSWYCFHQDMHDKDIEAECALAAKLGMKVIIVDDGWQTDDTNRGYSFCGDWQVSTNRFPDMAAHVKRVQALGMKYMVWYSVPFVGKKSANYARFKDKFLSGERDPEIGTLDPRFPEVRAFLIGTYEKALREWNLDGFKLDFIDAFSGERESETGNGRDIDTVPEAVDRLMKDVYAHLKAIKPGVLIEFRQHYVGPGIRQYGNMMRVSDCPGNYQVNRQGIARLRLTSGTTAVHADMLEWHPSEKTEDAARFVVNCLFGTIQYSMMLRTLPPDHLRMIRHWLDFTRTHRGALLKGGFRPHHPELGYPLLEGWDDAERIFSVHAPMPVRLPSDGRTVYVVNATAESSLVLDLAASCQVEVFDTFGTKVGARQFAAGLVRVACPVSGYLRLLRR